MFEPDAVIGHKVPAARGTLAYFRSRCYAEGLSKALVTHSVGAGDGLASERAYTFKTLPLGVLRGVGDAAARRPGRARPGGRDRRRPRLDDLGLRGGHRALARPQRARLTVRVPILMYHSVTDRPNGRDPPAGGAALGASPTSWPPEGRRLHPAHLRRSGRGAARTAGGRCPSGPS